MSDEEVLGAITSDKVETDNRNFATVKPDQVCEEPLIPRENAFRQIDWSVTLEKGSVYKPQEDVGVYAKEVECKYGAQINGDVYGRDSVEIEYGGSKHAALEGGEGDDKLGARVIGSVVSDGSVEVEPPGSRMDDWSEKPVEVYGDVVGSHVKFDEPAIVYGNVKAEKSFRSDAEVMVVGDVRSGGSLDATKLFAFSVSAEGDVTMREKNIVVNPTVLSTEGKVKIEDDVGVLDAPTVAEIQDGEAVETLSFGGWVFEEEAVWEGRVLKPVDVSGHVRNGSEGEKASLSWRTMNESEGGYAFVRSLLEKGILASRKDPPEIEEMRYSGISAGGLSKVEKTEITHEGEGDVVTGTQNKTVEKEDMTKIDRSVTKVDKSTEVYDESTTIEDSVLNRSEVTGPSGTEPTTPADDGPETSTRTDEKEAVGTEDRPEPQKPTDVKEEVSDEGDTVTGTQNKQVDKREVTDVDRSTSEVDESTTEVDRGTEVNDSVVNRSEVSGGEGASVEDSVVNRSEVRGEEEPKDEAVDESEGHGGQGTEGSTCPHCGAELNSGARYCIECGESI